MTFGYSPEADAQLDALESGPDTGLWDAVLDAIELIKNNPSLARSLSGAIKAEQGIQMKLAVPSFREWKVFWSTDEPRIEAVLHLP